MPVINVKNIGSNTVVTENLDYISGETLLRLKEHILHNGDIVFGRKGALNRHALIQKTQDGWIQGSDCIRVKLNADDSNYLDAYLQVPNVLQHLSKIAYGSTMLTLTTDMLYSVPVELPQLCEEKNIGNFFKVLNNLITLHQRKYDKLVNIKKSMLDKMFPKNGASVPEIRFKGFTDPWEQRKFSELILIERGGSPRPIDEYVTDSPDGLNWIKIGDAPEQGRYITKTAEKIKPEGLSKTRQVKPGDLILSNSMSFGKPYIMAIEGCIHDGWLLIRDTREIFDLKFLCQMLGTDQMIAQYKSLAAGSTVNNLNKELVGNTKVMIPELSEQRVLGQYFESIDTLITLHQRERIKPILEVTSVKRNE